jgi:hypothetical protein
LPNAALFHAVENYSSRVGGIFHGVELLPPIFPQCGKNGPKLFHCVEKWTQSCSIVWKKSGAGARIFPQCGTFVADFSTVWNFCRGFFHSVENPADAG